MVGETRTILQGIEELQAELRQHAEQQGLKAEKIGMERFILLLSGISSCRKAPGIDAHMGYAELKFCKSAADEELTREHLKRLYEITDKESLLEACQRLYRAGEEYEQFLSFWENTPVFDINELNDRGRRGFEACKSYAEKYRPFVGNSGFYAWDCNERIGLARKACACRLITEEDFWDITKTWARRAASLYDSWFEYAISCICGSAYFMFCQSNLREEEVLPIFEINRNMIRHLFTDNPVWLENSWFSFTDKKWAVHTRDIRQLLTDWVGHSGCMATDRIMVDGCKVGYMYREEVSGKYPDSGWRFFAGDESEEYTDNMNHTGIYDLNTLCNYDRDIIPLLHAPAGTAYFRNENGVFQEERFEPRED